MYNMVIVLYCTTRKKSLYKPVQIFGHHVFITFFKKKNDSLIRKSYSEINNYRQFCSRICNKK